MTKYRIWVKDGPGKAWHKGLIGNGMDDAKAKYEDWAKRPTEPKSSSVCMSKLSDNGIDWIILDDNEWDEFRSWALALPEVLSVTVTVI